LAFEAVSFSLRVERLNLNAKKSVGVVVVVAVAGLLGCSHLKQRGNQGVTDTPAKVQQALDTVQQKYAPDSHMAIFDVGIERHGDQLALTGEVDRAEAKIEALQALEKAGAHVTDRITVLPAADLGDKTWGIACLSVATGREKPDHKEEMETQILMGQVVRVWKTNRFWSLVQGTDAYLSWLERGAFTGCNRAAVDAWNSSRLEIVTAFEDCVRESPQAEAQPVSDVVMGDLLKQISVDGDGIGVELPDHRKGFLPKTSAAEYGTWRASRQASPENIERTAKMFLGRPYLWGGNSPKGLDCSGFTKLVFFLNGIELNRNASEQARQGTPLKLDQELSGARKGDLLFFGGRGRRKGPEWITHVAIYLGDKLFIQSSQRVRISSLDPDSPIFDERHARSLLFARRVLPEMEGTAALKR
jgi:cell wall-associated NlpC family hydrolase